MPGHCEIGETDLELHPADGHTADGMAIWIGWARVLVAGDYLSPVEVPMISGGGSRDAYIATLRRLEPLVDAAAHVVPGHGEVIEGARAAAILREDLNYLAKLPDAELPMARRGAAQRAIHAENVRDAYARAPRDPARRPRGARGRRRGVRRLLGAARLRAACRPPRRSPRARPGCRPATRRSTCSTPRRRWSRAEGHVAVIVADHDATLAALRDAGLDPQPRTEYWGSPRAFVRSPAGHRVELMAFAPGP